MPQCRMPQSKTAQAKQRRIRCLVFAVLLMGVGTVRAQPPEPAAALGALSGKLTDLRSAPLGGVTVILRNHVTGAEFRTRTARNGAYRFAGLAPGAYTLEAQSQTLGRGELDGIEIAAGHQAQVQAAMAFTGLPAPAAARMAPAPDSARRAPSPAQSLATAAPGSAIPLAQAPPPRTQALAAHPLPGTPAIPLRSTATVPLPSTPISAPLPMQAMAAWPSQPVNLPPAAVAALPTSITPGAARPLTLSAAVVDAAASSTVVALLSGAPQLQQAENGTVQAEPAAAAVTTTVSGEQIQALPASGRRWQELFLDTPASASTQGSSAVALRGAGQDPADTTIDGASTRLAFGDAGAQSRLQAQDSPDSSSSIAVPSGRSNAGRGFMVSEAAVREVRVVAGNAEAEGAHAAGGRTSVETESGANTLHGQAFLFDRQNTWGARNPFTSWLKETAPATSITTPVFSSIPFTPPDHEVAWGAGAGSRIRRDKLFWFAALDGYRRNDPGIAMARVPGSFFSQPSNAQAQLLSAQLQLPNTNPIAEGLAAYSSMLESLAGLLGPAPRLASQWSGFARLDWQAAERHRVTLEGTGSDWNSAGGGMTRVSENYGNASFGSSRATRGWLMARWEAFLSPNLLAVTQASAGRDILHAPPGTPSPFEQSFLRGNAYGQLPQIMVDGRYGFTIGNPARFGQGSYPDERHMHGQEMLDWVHGRLLVKAGLELDHDIDATTLLRNRTGSYYYSTVGNFISDALAFQKYGPNPSNPLAQHNCDARGRPWTSGGVLMGLGSLPCYSHFTQVIGPDFWQVATNDWAGYLTAQWQLNSWAVVSAGLRWELEQLPPPMKLVDNPELPQTEHLPALGSQWGPRIGLALGNRKRWPVLRLGYGMYFGRTENATLLTVLTQTGSPNGDQYFFIRPTDGYSSVNGTSSAPLFPNVLNGRPASVVVPSAVSYAPRFRNSEVHQALASVEEELPGRILVSAAAVLSLGRRLPISIDTNIDPQVNPGTITYAVKDPTGKGPLHVPQITVPYYALWPASDCSGRKLTVAGQCGRLNPDYQQVDEISSRANSTYEAAMVRFTRYGSRGLSFHAHYTYSHAMDWNPNESLQAPASELLDPADFNAEYGTSGIDVRHAAAAMVVYWAPWTLHGFAGHLVNRWMISGVGNYRSGMPYSMRVVGWLPQEHTTTGEIIMGLGPSMNGFGGDNRLYGVPRNTFRYPDTWKADVRLAKRFGLGERRQLELLAESFNLLNHRNITRIGTSGYAIESGSSAGSMPELCYLTLNAWGTDSCQSHPAAGSTGPLLPAFGQPLSINGTNYYRERQIQLGARFRF
jgi:hypothetical protein